MVNGYDLIDNCQLTINNSPFSVFFAGFVVH